MAREPTCSGPADRFAAYVRGELPTGEAARLEAHVVACCSCADRLTQEARVEAALYDFGEVVEQELSRVPPAMAIVRWWTRHRPRLVPRLGPMPAWGSLAIASALAFVVCDRAALQGLVDGASPAPGTLASRSPDAAPVDEVMPRCEEPALAGALVGDGPACLEPLALASWPSDVAGDFDPDEDEGVCQPDDGGELVCSADTPLAG